MPSPRHAPVTLVLGALFALALALPAGADEHEPPERPRAACRAACAARNMEASCAWLAGRARPCLRNALKACMETVRQGGAAACPPPADLPACLTNRSCPYGALCADGVCQVVACASEDGFSNCTGRQQCVEGRCVVAECEGSSENCPAGMHCALTSTISGTCQANDPTRTHCMTNTDCIAPGEFNPRCYRGVCGMRRKPRECEADGDCFEACKTSRAAVRIPRCDGGGRCVCANCVDDAQCTARFGCADGQSPMCRSNGTCYCPPPEQTSGGRGVCTTFENPACTSCATDADCGGGFDVCLQSASCVMAAEPPAAP